MNSTLSRSVAGAGAILLLVPILAACGDAPSASPAASAPTSVVVPTIAPADPATSAPAPTPVDLSQARAKPFDAGLIAQLEPYISTTMQRMGVPGVVVAIVQDGKVVYAHGFGVRELGKPDPVTPDTLFMMGSDTKSMTTMMMATVVDDGKMAWDTPAVRVLPEFAVGDPQLTPKITMRDMVCNCTGIQRHDIEAFLHTDQLNAQGAIGVVRSLATFDFTGEFGKTFGYSNQMVASGGYLAARAASGATGDLYAEYLRQMQRRVFDPIGMPNTTFALDAVEANPNHAIPHGRLADWSLVPVPLSLEHKQVDVMAPAGAAWSNVRDQARYLITQLSRGVSPGGRRVVSAANLTKTWQPQVQITPEASYGLGWVSAPYQGARWLQHEGEVPGGFSSDLGFLPDADLGYVVLTNAQSDTPFMKAVHYRILELAFGQPIRHDAQLIQMADDMQQQAKAALANPQPRIDPATIAPYLGRYTNPTVGEFALTLERDKLMLDVGTMQFELRSLGNGTYIGWDPPVSGIPFTLKQVAGQPVVTMIDPWTNQPIVFARAG